MILIKIYIVAVICGLLFPLADSFMYGHIHSYREDADQFIIDYRTFTVWRKLLLAILPVFNLLWIISMISTIVLIVLSSYVHLRIQFVVWLAKRPGKKRFAFRTKLVKKIFPDLVKVYYAAYSAAHTKDIASELVNICVHMLKNGDIKADITVDKFKDSENLKEDGHKRKN